MTNFKTLKKNIARLKEIEKMEADGTFDILPRKEVMNLNREHKKLDRGLGGLREMPILPSIIYVVDSKKEIIAVKEARKLGIPIVGLIDTNGDPDEVDYPIPANDDAIKSIKLLTAIIANAVLAGRQVTSPDQVEMIPEELADIKEVVEELSEEERLQKLAESKDIK